MEKLTQRSIAVIGEGEEKKNPTTTQEKVAHVFALVHTQKPSFIWLLLHILKALLAPNFSSLLPLQPSHLSGTIVNWARAGEIRQGYKPSHLLHGIAQIPPMRYERGVSWRERRISILKR